MADIVDNALKTMEENVDKVLEQLQNLAPSDEVAVKENKQEMDKFETILESRNIKEVKKFIMESSNEFSALSKYKQSVLLSFLQQSTFLLKDSDNQFVSKVLECISNCMLNLDTCKAITQFFMPTLFDMIKTEINSIPKEFEPSVRGLKLLMTSLVNSLNQI